MKLSPRLISYYLQKKYALSESRLITSAPSLRYPLLSSGTAADRGEVVYIENGTSLWRPERIRDNSLVVFTGGIDPRPFAMQTNVLVLKQKISAGEILSAVDEIFDLFDEWDEACMQSRLNNGSIQNLLDITGRIISNPLLLIGLDFTVIASRNTEYGTLKNSILGTTESTLDLVLSLKNDPFYESCRNRIGFFFYPGNHVATPQLCVNIRRQDETAFRLMMGAGEVPIDGTFGFLMERLARYITHGLSTAAVVSHTSAQSLHRVFHTILTDPTADYVEVSRQLTNQGWLSQHTYRCLLVEAGVLDARNLTLRSICSYIENAIPGSCVIEYKGNAIAFIDLTLCSLDEGEIAQRIAGFIRDSMLNAGYSRDLLGHFNFQRMYVQAMLSLKVGRRRNPSRWIHHFNDIALYYLLEQTTRKLPAYMLADERLLNLKNLADSEASPLYETLRIFLEKNQNITHTSDALFIHRSTLLYRLEKIEKMLHLDLSDPSQVLYLTLSFRMLDLEDENRTKEKGR